MTIFLKEYWELFFKFAMVEVQMYPNENNISAMPMEVEPVTATYQTFSGMGRPSIV